MTGETHQPEAESASSQASSDAQTMDKRFDPASYEAAWQRRWSDANLFCCPTTDASGEPFCVLIPPPNVTGKLHMGHALQSALQDLMVRWRRMQGYNALWLPGTDHAGIATQLMVERQLESEGSSRIELGREKFEERMWEWKQTYHSNIRDQLERLGSSCDWSRERFTLDEGLNLAVRTAFVRMYREGLIYRGEYMVNWSPILGTAISDLEVEMKSVQGKLYHIAYPLEGEDGSLVVATTRPETMLGDMAVAAHPEDERYRHLIGQNAILPLIGRKLPIIADEHVDPEFGTGLVKITPFHDLNDYEMASRHGIGGLRVIDFDGRMTSEAGPEFEGLDRFEARAKVLDRLREAELLKDVVDHVHNVGHSQRSGEPVEPMVSDQWFCNMDQVAERALRAVETDELELHPPTWNKTWRHWLENIRPWVISRQLWWGHRVPAWYDPDGNCHVAMTREEAAELAGTDELRQDDDVLDTWFSSGLWPLSTLGWPDEDAPDLKTFYPTSVLITGFDILFFWVARMVMMGLQFSDQVPFRAVHLTGLVRDAKGEKMSKTKGNTLDPLELVEEYGADAVRFTLCALDTPGRDIPLDPQRMAGYRAFGNKIWNATRFALTRLQEESAGGADRGENRGGDLEVSHSSQLGDPERWILSRLTDTIETVNRKFEDYRFDEACGALHGFFWHELCDWYIELCKPALSGDAPRPDVEKTLVYVLDQSLRLLHPVMPHLTEEVWQRLPEEARDTEFLAVASYPTARTDWRDERLEAEFEGIQQLVTWLRAQRKERGLGAKVPMRLFLEGGDDTHRVVLDNAPLISHLARLESIEVGPGPERATRDLIAGIEVAAEIDAPDEGPELKERLRKELAGVEKELGNARGRLGNEQFLSKAPEHVVEGVRARLAELEERQAVLLKELGDD